MGKSIYLTARATDAAGQRASLSLLVYVESPSKGLASWQRCPARSWTQTPRGCCTGTVMASPSIHEQRRLASEHDAVRRHARRKRVPDTEWRDLRRGLQRLPMAQQHPCGCRRNLAGHAQGSGKYAIWGQMQVDRVDTDSGVTQRVTTAALTGSSLASDGTVVFSNDEGQLIRDRLGVQAPLPATLLTGTLFRSWTATSSSPWGVRKWLRHSATGRRHHHPAHRTSTTYGDIEPHATGSIRSPAVAWRSRISATCGRRTFSRAARKATRFVTQTRIQTARSTSWPAMERSCW